MSKMRELAVLGGDARQWAMIEYFANAGYQVNVWGLGTPRLSHARVTVCSDWREAVDGADDVILPLPATVDGISINCPLKKDPSVRLRIPSLLENVGNRRVFAGRLGETLSHVAEQKGVTLIDYFDNERLQLRNALPSAEGAIAIAMRELPVTIDGTVCAVIGYGRIGMLLARKLQALGARVTVYARRGEVRTLAELYGHATKALCEREGYSTLKQLPKDCRVVFNTVPQRLFGKEILESVPKNCVLIDLASAPGGMDMAAAEALGLSAVWGTALPGKYAPETAGAMLAQTLIELLENSSDPIA